VKKFEGRPFVLLGVNTDHDAAALRKIQQEQDITWRSWVDGSPGSGPICKAWGVQSFPTMYLIDHQGIIRYGPDAPAEDLLDKLVEDLVRKAENDAAKLGGTGAKD
jgi:hypothetical protein